MSLGSTLKEARERKGLTIAQVAEQTRMIHQLVEEIEQDDFHRISAAVYGRGFIKLLAECVGEEPAPLIQEFTEIYSGLRRPGVRTRPVQTPVENPEVEEPKDRNAPPPRPKVRAVVLADEEEPAPASAPAAPTPVESPKPEVDTPAAPVESLAPETDAPAATEAPVELAPVEAPKPEVETPAAPVESLVPETDATEAPVEPAPVEAPKPEFETPAAPVENPAPETDAPAAPEAPVEPAPVETPKPEVETPAAPVESPAPETDAPAAPEAPVKPAPVETPKPEVESPEAPETVAQEEDTSLLGELFDFSSHKRTAGQAGESTQAKDTVRDESSIKISLPQEAPSWDDAPLDGETGFFNSLIRHLNIRIVAAVLGGIVLLSAIVFGVVAKRHSKPAEAPVEPVVSQVTTVSEPQPEPAPPIRAPTPTRTPPPTQTPTPTPPADAVAAAPADGKTVYTHNLIPPPDSYVE